MLFDPTKTFSFFYVYFIAKVLCCLDIRTEQKQLTEPLKNFQVSKALMVASEKIRLNHRWPKRNITGGLVRNMRVCMGAIEFET